MLNAVESSRGTTELAPVTPVNGHPGDKIKNFQAYRNELVGFVVPRKVARRQTIADYRNKTYLVKF